MAEQTSRRDGSRYSVRFCRSPSDLEELQSAHVIIYPVSNDWNDFGLKTRCHFIVRDDLGGSHKGTILVGFLGVEQDAHSIIDEAISKNGGMPLPAKGLPNYFSMLPEMQAYRHLINDMGLKGAKEILSSTHDLVLLRYFPGTPSWVNQALSSQMFALSFMRSSESFFAFHNAGSILDGLEEEVLGKVSSALNLNFKLDGFENSHELKFRFDSNSVMPKRICVLIGKNGLGKSQVLSHIVHGALNVDKSLSEPDGGRPMISRLLAIGTPGETNNTFPKERNGQSSIIYRRLFLTRGVHSKGSRGVGELLVQLARSGESIKERGRWDIFCESLKPIIILNQVGVPLRDSVEITVQTVRVIRQGRKRYVNILDLVRGGQQAMLEIWAAIKPTGEPVRLVGEKSHPLSSGELSFLRFAVQACLFIENGTLVLLDEPETHLHPNYVSEYVRLLDRLLEMTGSIAVLATHSAYIVREVPRSQVLVFKQDEDGRVHIQNPRLKTFGADVGSISYFVFEDEITNALVEELIGNLPISREGKIESIKELEDELSSEILMYLRRRLEIGQESEKD